MRDHILDTAAKLFYRHGLRAVGVDRIIEEAGIAKATLYKHFRTKETLIVAYLASRHRFALDAMTFAVESAGTDLVARASAPFNWLQSRVSDDFRGCAFLLAVAEHENSPEIRAVAVQHKDAVRDLFASAVAGLGRAAARDMARQLALLYDGALAAVIVRRNDDGVVLARKCAAALVKAAAG
ncbi:TetR/AcrR family transcriptional regulator [Paraburkholderia sp. BCC1886]|uniref:TetR/AcrR family transcriptional regulator n=1 Tax=Paraburkholderia sp. BCC1886 TaxID=2562670 RepID=UPI0011824993|nr:TetR/AcrR family transcriptional regulator [Paraburkholderia sp. BCC1886]